MPQRKCLEPLPGTGTLRPPSRQGPQPVYGPLLHHLSGYCSEKNRATYLALPLFLCSSCHIVNPSLERTHPATQLPHPRLSQVDSPVKEKLPEGQWFASLGTLLSALRLREAPWWPRSRSPGKADRLGCALPASAATVLLPPPRAPNDSVLQELSEG